ncbi:synapse-associated protein 1 [Limosa lapponica baueri]|uniref:Synapse-associated protein 1 n=1 Tax=Limosa lapponica baueri TaxID=1758121 RepID=A0A2I0TVN2_LIMLA|nr:synapse-associated protein 1 [Limosa lapponica baueri]
MLRGLGSWLGLERPGEEKLLPAEERSSSVEEEEETAAGAEPAAQSSEPAELQGDSEALLSQAKGLGSYLFNFATAATKKISESVAETAQTIKKSVEEGKIDSIIDKQTLASVYISTSCMKIEAAVPPWVDSNEEETIQQQILALSADKRNFLRDPPAGVQFNFDFDQMYPVAMVMLQEDELLNRMRFDLVPKHVKEEVFWRNYFYRVSLIKQSAQLTALAAQQQAVGKEENKGREEDSQLKGLRPNKVSDIGLELLWWWKQTCMQDMERHTMYYRNGGRRVPRAYLGFNLEMKKLLRCRLLQLH